MAAPVGAERPGLRAPFPEPSFGPSRRANTAAQRLHLFPKFGQFAKHISRGVRIPAPHTRDRLQDSIAQPFWHKEGKIRFGSSFPVPPPYTRGPCLQST